MAPEYISTGHLTFKNDVWSYGVFLYELITGRRPWDWSGPKNSRMITDLLKPFVQPKKLELIIDPRLEGNYYMKSAYKLHHI